METVLQQALHTWAVRYGREEFEARLNQVTEEYLDGVTVTSVSFGDGSGSGQSNRTPQELMENMQQVLKILDGEGSSGSQHQNFSCRIVTV